MEEGETAQAALCREEGDLGVCILCGSIHRTGGRRVAPAVRPMRLVAGAVCHLR